MKKIIIIFLFSYCCCHSIFCQNNNGFPADFEDNQRGLSSMRVMFYNVENLFDTKDDTLKADEDFTPNGNHYWSNKKYWQKQNNIAKVISAVGGWEIPAVIGLCEVENKNVLFDLCRKTSLKKYNYSFIHHESSDRRGIDVAFVYRNEKVTILKDTAYEVCFPFDTSARTRNILHLKCVCLNTDTIHFFVTHWPSKYGGAFATIPKRVYVAQQINNYVKNIQTQNPKAKVLIMGDFNDAPEEKSVKTVLNAQSPEDYKSGDLVNLMLPLSKGTSGTHFYSGNTGSEWSVIDQIVVSSSMLESKKGLKVKSNCAYIFKADFLLETKNNGFIVPYRTFIGYKYNGGFSDHLPIYLDFEISK